MPAADTNRNQVERLSSLLQHPSDAHCKKYNRQVFFHEHAKWSNKMKTPGIKYLLLLSGLAAALSLSGCGDKTYGSGIDPKVEVKTVAEIFTNPQLQGQKVTVEGRIHAQCPSNGCWFVLQDHTGQIYVDLSRNGFELPPMQGRTIAAAGVVAPFQGPMMMIIAEGVELR
jgi:uncharacterized protein YdeI (BOF family)